MSENDRIANPYKVLGQSFVESPAISLADRLRQYAFFRQDSAVGPHDTLLAMDLFEAVRCLEEKEANQRS